MRSELGRVSERREWHMSNYFRLSRIVRIKGLPCLLLTSFPKKNTKTFLRTRFEVSFFCNIIQHGLLNRCFLWLDSPVGAGLLSVEASRSH
jgi:hypothetical protein